MVYQHPPPDLYYSPRIPGGGCKKTIAPPPLTLLLEIILPLIEILGQVLIGIHQLIEVADQFLSDGQDPYPRPQPNSYQISL